MGSHAASLLCRAGVGRLQLVDRDVVEPSNLPRQVLFDDSDARSGRPKAAAASARLRRVNPDCEIDPVIEDFSTSTFDSLGHRPDVILDGTDNFRTRMLINDLAIRDATPWIYAGAVGGTGRSMVVMPGVTPCLRCVLPEPPSAGEIGTCESDGVLATAVAHVAAFQATEAIRLLTSGRREFTRGTFTCDVWNAQFAVRAPHAEPDPDCPSCGLGELPALDTRSDDAVALCGRDAVQVRPRSARTIDLKQLAAHLGDWASEVEQTPHMLRFTTEDCRFTVFRGGRALVFGTREPERARVLYDRYIGV